MASADLAVSIRVYTAQLVESTKASVDSLCSQVELWRKNVEAAERQRQEQADRADRAEAALALVMDEARGKISSEAWIAGCSALRWACVLPAVGQSDPEELLP